MPIVVQLTSPDRGAIATIRVEGPEAEKIVAAHFRPASGRAMASYNTDQHVFGRFHFGGEHGEEVVVRREADDAVEIHCHGGSAAVCALQRALVEAGCRPISWQDWVKAHEQNPIAADARIALAAARTLRAAEILLDQYQGALGDAIDRMKRPIASGHTADAATELGAILARTQLGRHLTEPWRVVVAGPPNVGKSSLINAMVGYRRAIVHATPGTTRDIVSASTAIRGWPVELSDTAGLRVTSDPVEQAGVEQALAQIAVADLVVLVFDHSKPWSASDQELVDRFPDALVVSNKADLPPHDSGGLPRAWRTSALTGDGLDALLAAIAARIVPEEPPGGAAVPFTAAQTQRLKSAAAALACGDTETAHNCLSFPGRLN